MTNSLPATPTGVGPISRAPIPATLIHELRTPLTAIQGYAQVIHRNPVDETLVRRGSDVLVRESLRLSWMLSELGEIAELESPGIALDLARTDIVELVAPLCARAAERAPWLDVRLVPGSPLAIHCDPRRVSQILWHLFLNAIKYTGRGGAVEATVRPAKRGIEVVIADTGLGIGQDEAEAVYEPFRRGRAATEVGERGLGLGLYLAAEVARHCGGGLRHAAREAAGTEFCLRLPVDPGNGEDY